MSTPLPHPGSVWCVGPCHLYSTGFEASVHLLQPAPVPAWVSMPLVTVVTAVSQLPDLLGHWTPQTLRAWLPSQPRPRGSSLWPGTGSLVRGYHQAFCTEASGRQYHETAYRHSSHHAHRADITYIHPSQHSTHSADTPHPTDNTCPHP